MLPFSRRSRRLVLLGSLLALIGLFGLRYASGLAQLDQPADDRRTGWLPLLRQLAESPSTAPEPTATAELTTTATLTATSDPLATATLTLTLAPITMTPSVTATITLTATLTSTTTSTATAISTVTSTATAISTPQPYRVLVFSKTAAYRHDAIPKAIAAVEALGAANGFSVDATEDSALFTSENLARYQAVIFMMTSGDVLNSAQEAIFEGYIRAGGGYVGFHSASDTEYDWAWYGQLVGAYFKNHPPTYREATMRIEDRTHPSTVDLGATWTRRDEWYNFRSNPRGQVHVLITLDESSYSGGEMGADHPIAWCHNFDGGRSWYSGLTHDRNAFQDARMQSHLLGGIEYAAGVRGGCPVTNAP